MTQHLTTDIAILGAGVVGLAIAEALTAEGREVVVVDPAQPAMGASYGNAGTIADYAVMPVGSPDVLRNLPSLLFDKNSPLAIRRAALPALLPWLARFARQSLPGPAYPIPHDSRVQYPAARCRPPAPPAALNVPPPR